VLSIASLRTPGSRLDAHRNTTMIEQREVHILLFFVFQASPSDQEKLSLTIDPKSTPKHPFIRTNTYNKIEQVPFTT
jgi:hypothetical protein